LKVKRRDEEFNTEDAEGAEKKRKSTGLKAGHYKEEPYD
jgi:hypothetical protein